MGKPRCASRRPLRLLVRGVLPAVLGLLAVGAAQAAAAPVIRVDPALTPAFEPSIHNYVTRCGTTGSVNVFVRAAGTPTSVDGAAAKLGISDTTVPLTSGQGFQITTGTGSDAESYEIRCLPSDFPGYSSQELGPTQAAYYLVTPTGSYLGESTPYVAMFDSNGVPVWWYRQPDGGVPIDAALDPDGDLSWAVEDNLLTFGGPGQVHLEVHSLDGALVNTLNTVGSPTDLHEALPLDNGDFLIDSYVPQTGVDLTSIGGPKDGQVLYVAFQWSAAGKVKPAESQAWSFLRWRYPGMTGKFWDLDHINSVQPYDAGYLVSLRDTNAIYYIRASDGSIVWKLGGTTTPQSLTILGDPDAAHDFGAQHDVRAWPDGTVSVHDNGGGQHRPPRVVRYRIDAAAGTATLVETLSDPLNTTPSQTSGSARLMPGGDWTVAWGATPYVDEITPTNQVVFRLRFAPPIFTYRAIPILPDQISPAQLEAAMDTMYPRPASGS
jgi:hypothetical protein